MLYMYVTETSKELYDRGKKLFQTVFFSVSSHKNDTSSTENYMLYVTETSRELGDRGRELSSTVSFFFCEPARMVVLHFISTK